MNKFKKLISYYKPYKKEFLLDLFFSFVTAICMAIVPLIVRNLTGEVINLPYNQALKYTICEASIVLIIFFIIMEWSIMEIFR